MEKVICCQGGVETAIRSICCNIVILFYYFFHILTLIISWHSPDRALGDANKRGIAFFLAGLLPLISATHAYAHKTKAFIAGQNKCFALWYYQTHQWEIFYWTDTSFFVSLLSKQLVFKRKKTACIKKTTVEGKLSVL